MVLGVCATTETVVLYRITICPGKFSAGTLNEELKAAAEMTIAAMQDDLTAGFQVHEAWEMEREHHLIVREEKDE